MSGRISYLTARQILERSKDLHNLQAVYDKLLYHRIQGIKEHPEKGWSRLVYPVDEDFFMTKDEVAEKWRRKGYVNVEMLASRFHVAKQTVCKKICSANLAHEFMDTCRRRYWKDGLWTWELFHVEPPDDVKEKYGPKSPEEPPPPPPPKKEKPVKMRFGNPEVDAILDMEEEKKRWIGKRGRIIVRGKVAVEGIIESVSSCGVYIKGSNVRGNINELELCSTPGERVEESRVPDEEP